MLGEATETFEVESFVIFLVFLDYLIVFHHDCLGFFVFIFNCVLFREVDDMLLKIIVDLALALQPGLCDGPRLVVDCVLVLLLAGHSRQMTVRRTEKLSLLLDILMTCILAVVKVLRGVGSSIACATSNVRLSFFFEALVL